MKFIEKIQKSDGFDDCLKSSGAKKDDLFVLPPKNTHEVFCFKKCMMDKREMINADGSIKFDEFDKNFKEQVFSDVPQKFLDAMKKCMEDVKITKCDDLKIVSECFQAAVKSNN